MRIKMTQFVHGLFITPFNYLKLRGNSIVIYTYIYVLESQQFIIVLLYHVSSK